MILAVVIVIVLILPYFFVYRLGNIDRIGYMTKKVSGLMKLPERINF